MNERKDVEEIFDVTMVVLFPDMMRHSFELRNINKSQSELMKKIHTQTYHNETAKHQREKEVLKTSRGKRQIC